MICRVGSKGASSECCCSPPSGCSPLARAGRARATRWSRSPSWARPGRSRARLEDAIREFERLSRERHAADPAYPVYRVVSGQNASRNQTEDPTRFLVSLAGGMPPDVIFFDRFAISEWAARGAFTPLDDYVEHDLAAWDAWQLRLATDPDARRRGPGAAEEPPRAAGAPRLAADRADPRRTDFFAACWDEAVYRNPADRARAALYGIPTNADNRVLLYNKDILIRHGYTNEHGEARPPTNVGGTGGDGGRDDRARRTRGTSRPSASSRTTATRGSTCTAGRPAASS